LIKENKEEKRKEKKLETIDSIWVRRDFVLFFFNCNSRKKHEEEILYSHTIEFFANFT